MDKRVRFPFEVTGDHSSAPVSVYRASRGGWYPEEKKTAPDKPRGPKSGPKQTR